MAPAESTMTRDVIFVPPALSLRYAWGIMQRWRIRHLPIVDGATLLGVLSDRDVLLHARPEADGTISVPELPVARAMTADPFTCGRSTPIAEVTRIMTEHKIDSVVVVDPSGAVVGLVTSTDLLMLLLVGDPARPLPFEFNVRDGES